MTILVVAATALSACGPAASRRPTRRRPHSRRKASWRSGSCCRPRMSRAGSRTRPASRMRSTAAGYDVEILFSQGDSAKEKANVEALITKGIKVLIICPQDGTAAAAAAEAARAAGVKVISYDRLIRDTDAVDYYVTFDSIAVGAAQAQYLVDKATGTGNPLYLYAGAASDNNAFLFFEGAWNVLQPKIADGTFVIKNSSEAVALQDKATLTRDEIGQDHRPGHHQLGLQHRQEPGRGQPDRRHGRRQGQCLHPRPERRHRPRHRRRLCGRQGCHELRCHRPGRREGFRPVHHRRQAVHDGLEGRPHAGGGRHRRGGRLPRRRDARADQHLQQRQDRCPGQAVRGRHGRPRTTSRRR